MNNLFKDVIIISRNRFIISLFFILMILNQNLWEKNDYWSREYPFQRFFFRLLYVEILMCIFMTSSIATFYYLTKAL